MHRKRIFNWHRLLLLMFCAAMLTQQGCLVHRKHFSLGSMWFDYNSYRAPALFFTKREHRPYKASQVSLFHWQYGVTPGKDVQFERPDLWGGDQPYHIPHHSVMNVSGTQKFVESEQPFKPTATPNGSMNVAPQKFIPPPPGAPPAQDSNSQPLLPLKPIPPAP